MNEPLLAKLWNDYDRPHTDLRTYTFGSNHRNGLICRDYT